MGEEGGMTGPGAPTPLSALEVSFDDCNHCKLWLTDVTGHCGLDQA